MHRKLGLAPSAECSSGTGEQTAEHVLQQCPKLQELRTAVWPEETSLHSKLHGKGVAGNYLACIIFTLHLEDTRNNRRYVSLDQNVRPSARRKKGLFVC
nr:hypothetical protein BaRGS_006260 [Batillaria attramentaria]